MTSTRPIVVGIDGSEASIAALRWAVGEARQRDCPVRALLAWHSAQVSGYTPGLAVPHPLPETNAKAVAQAVYDIVNEVDSYRVATEVVEGWPGQTLVEASKFAQLLVIGSHGHGKIYESVLGGVAAHCIRHAACPVVVIPAGLEVGMDDGDRAVRGPDHGLADGTEQQPLGGPPAP